MREAGAAVVVTGYALAHPYPAMMAASVMTFFNALATPLDTPAHRQAQSGLARVLWELGCREAPLMDESGLGGFDFAEQLDVLDQEDVIDRPVWALTKMGGGRLQLVQHLPRSSPLHACRYPGYPQDWQPLWYGELWELRRADGTGRSSMRPEDRRRLMRAGVAELANLCNEDGDLFLSAADAASACQWIRAFGACSAFDALTAFLAEAGVEPVPGRRPWTRWDQRTPHGSCSQAGKRSRCRRSFHPRRCSAPRPRVPHSWRGGAAS